MILNYLNEYMLPWTFCIRLWTRVSSLSSLVCWVSPVGPGAFAPVHAAQRPLLRWWRCTFFPDIFSAFDSLVGRSVRDWSRSLEIGRRAMVQRLFWLHFRRVLTCASRNRVKKICAQNPLHLPLPLSVCILTCFRIILLRSWHSHPFVFPTPLRFIFPDL